MRTSTFAVMLVTVLFCAAGGVHAQAPASSAPPADPPPPVAVPRPTLLMPPPTFKRAPRLVASTPPEYPAAERRAGIEGDVVISLMVLEDGTTRAIEVRMSSGSAALDAAAVAAARTWRYEPAIGLDDQPMNKRVQQRLKFRLEDSAGEGGSPAPGDTNPFYVRCADVGTSVSAFLQANPGKKANEAPILQTTAGMVFLVGPGESRKTQDEWLKSVPFALDEILRQCADKPMSTVGDFIPAALAAARAAPVPKE